MNAAATEIATALTALRDVAGVGGSFYVDSDGSLLGQDMPAYFDRATLEEAGPRAWRLFELWPADPSSCDCVVRFEECRLYFRGNGQGLLCVLLVSAPQMSALRTAADLVGRRLTMASSLPPPAALPSVPPPMPSPARSSTPAPPPPSARGVHPDTTGRLPQKPAAVGPSGQDQAAGRPRRVRIYRGQRYEY